MDINKIKELVNILENSSLTSLEIEQDDMKIKLGKEIENKVISTSNKIDNKLIKDVVEVKEDSNKQTINSPLVGTFYSKPSPEENDFVQVNQKINKGDVICIIEAMKVMNEIKAEKDGIIKEILVANEELVEFDQPLFVIE
ncbi:MAG: acetyl-CoA carboxylase biotin carboxyl carrier protein [Bacilli bacterium]|jgi:acetyl-CoA carboxylase biotin carboxyl carrier protein|nr:acetyl-CoA carboxylase biotin carboxyl carrier protein [Bacilli bacterium]